MKMLVQIDEDYVVSYNDTFLCPHCHSTVEYDIISSKSEVAKYHWICHSCDNEHEQYLLKVLLVDMPKPSYDKDVVLYGN